MLAMHVHSLSALCAGVTYLNLGVGLSGTDHPLPLSVQTASRTAAR